MISLIMEVVNPNNWITVSLFDGKNYERSYPATMEISEIKRLGFIDES